MACIALRVPTVVPDQNNLPGGYCYIIFDWPVISVRDLIAEKVRAELRKVRIGGPEACSLHLLINADEGEIKDDPLSEVLAIEQAWAAFDKGHYLLLVDGRPMSHTDENIMVTRRTSILFLVPAAKHGTEVSVA